MVNGDVMSGWTVVMLCSLDIFAAEQRFMF